MKSWQIPVPGLKKPLRVLHVTDAHVGPIEEGHPKSALLKGRMEHLHGEFGEGYEGNFEALMKLADPEKLDAVFLTGDAIDFPTGAAIGMAAEIISRCPCPVFFTSGNHDWNFCDEPGTNRLRATQRPWLGPLYNGGVAMGCQKWDLGGLRVIAVDDSTYQIDAEQLAFVRQHLAEGLPTVLLLHIPVTQPALRERTVAKWSQPIVLGEEIDEAIRKQWSVETPVPETGEFIRLLREAPNLRGIFSGHVHFAHEEQFSTSALQYVGAPAFAGGSRLIEFLPR